jgi:hypothetical protein
MIFYAIQNGKYFRGVMNFKGEVVFQEEITKKEYFKTMQ